MLVPPPVDALDDPFAGRRPVRLPNGSWPIQVRKHCCWRSYTDALLPWLPRASRRIKHAC